MTLARTFNGQEGQIAAGDGGPEAIKTDLNNIISAVNSESDIVGGIDSRLIAAELEISSIDGRLTTEEGKVSTAQSNISTLQGQMPQVAYNTYTGDGNQNRDINIGFRPNYVCIQSLTDGRAEFIVLDGGRCIIHILGSSGSFHTAGDIEVNNTGFRLRLTSGGSELGANSSGQEYVYFAIKKGTA